jgi:cell division protein FtsW
MIKRNSQSAPRMDYMLIIALAALLFIGLIMVYSATFYLGYHKYDNPAYFINRQLIFSAVGFVALFFAMRTNYLFWRKYSILLMAGALALLVIVLILGHARFGSQRWLLAGSIQPSEIAKLAAIVYIADWLTSKGERIRKVTYGLIPFAILIGVIAGLILLQPDFSTALLIVATAMVMFFVAGGELWQMLITTILGGGTLGLMILQSAYRLNRVQGFLDPMGDPLGKNYQIQQILIALGSGGVFGMGLGVSRQKFGYIPASHTDGIFAIMGEEMGFLGCLLLLSIFAFLAFRGFRVALHAPDSFSTILAAGITFNLIFQALINVATVTATIPFTGVPLPFISYGGSSLVICMIMIGILLSISRGSDSGGEDISRATFNFWRWNRRPHLSSSRRHPNN